jgi:hypothetical protein
MAASTMNPITLKLNPTPSESIVGAGLALPLCAPVAPRVPTNSL